MKIEVVLGKSTTSIRVTERKFLCFRLSDKTYIGSGTVWRDRDIGRRVGISMESWLCDLEYMEKMKCNHTI